ncbi:MFS general substrate transporter [Diplocarpon rosae]|nr:MFS general substrate transporter [Diplocarpon rosae]
MFSPGNHSDPFFESPVIPPSPTSVDLMPPLAVFLSGKPHFHRHPSSELKASVEKEVIDVEQTPIERLDSVVETRVSSGAVSVATGVIEVPSRAKDLMLRFRAPKVQLFLLSLIAFLCPGMWNAINGLGGGGLVAAEPANMANIALYATFAVVGFCAGIPTNKLGVRLTLALGGLGYAVYTSSLFCYKHTANDGFLIFAGVILGFSAGLFWAAQGMMVTSYPVECDQGKSAAWFWGIYNLGAVIGSVISLIQSQNSITNDVTDGTFIAFIALSCCGVVLSLSLAEPKDVVRSDGVHVSLPEVPTWKSAILSLFDGLYRNPRVFLLFPMFFASNIFYPYQFNTFNLTNFTIRTRSLNNAIYWLAEIFGGYAMGYLLDLQYCRKKIRAILAIVAILVITNAIWGGAYAWELKIAAAKRLVGPGVELPKTDYNDSGYAAALILYMCFGFLAASYQIVLYWIIGSHEENNKQLANIAGFYKGIQSAGGAVSFRINTIGLNPIHELIMCWSFLAAGLVCATPLALGIKERQNN